MTKRSRSIVSISKLTYIPLLMAISACSVVGTAGQYDTYRGEAGATATGETVIDRTANSKISPAANNLLDTAWPT